jgi:hypothetical protein
MVAANRDWAFPVDAMQAATHARVWRSIDFDRVLGESERLPGLAHVSWKRELSGNDAKVRAWALGLFGADSDSVAAVDDDEEDIPGTTKRNPAWNRDELILALDLYLRHRASPPSKTSNEVAELSAFLGILAGVRGATRCTNIPER